MVLVGTVRIERRPLPCQISKEASRDLPKKNSPPLFLHSSTITVSITSIGTRTRRPTRMVRIAPSAAWRRKVQELIPSILARLIDAHRKWPNPSAIFFPRRRRNLCTYQPSLRDVLQFGPNSPHNLGQNRIHESIKRNRPPGHEQLHLNPVVDYLVVHGPTQAHTFRISEVARSK